MVPWCVICALSWVDRHLFMSPWKTHKTSVFLNSHPCALDAGSIWEVVTKRGLLYLH